ncbi:MAG: chemotaxis protein MotB [Candidatus Dadabacteria bacterium]|nr:MAG: chemotaxis protein MotB [Candidatus Dadabacteria bacterium]
MRGWTWAALGAAVLLAGCGVAKEEYLKAVDRAGTLEARLRATEQELEAERKGRAEAEEALARCREEREDLDGKARDLAARLADAEADAARWRDRTKEREADLDLCGKARQEAESRVEACERRREEELTALRAEKLDVESRLEACRADLADLKAKLELVEAERRRAEQEKREKLDEVSRTYQGLLQGMEKEVEEGRVVIEQLKGKLSVKVLDEILFDSGSARIKPEGEEVLRRLGEVLKAQTEKAIVIEGHTDNVPISGALAERFPTNWELSTARATSVVRFLQDQVGVEPERLSAVGFGPYRPVASNDTPEGRARNRRIEIKLVPLEAPLFAPPEGSE